MKKVQKRLQLNKTIISSLNLTGTEKLRPVVGGDDSDGCFCTIEATDCIIIGCGTSAPAPTNGPTEANVCWPYTIPYICGWTGGGGDTGGGGGFTNSWNPLYCY